MTKRGFTEGTWNGITNYKCDFCAYAAPGKAGLLRIKRHVAGHFMRGDAPETVLDFASDDTAEKVLNDPDRDELLVILAEEVPPSGARGGWIADDVKVAREILAARRGEDDTSTSENGE